METVEFIQEKTKSVNWRMTFKVLIIGVLTLVLLIPQMMIMGLISEREKTANETKTEVMKQWSMLNTVRGPVLTIPYIEHTYDNVNKVMGEEIRYCRFLPKSLNINGEIFPQERQRSIYKVMVYKSKIVLSGYFETPDFQALNIKQEDIIWEKAQLIIGINDLRGISESAEMLWNNQKYIFSPGMGEAFYGQEGISVQFNRDFINEFPGEFLCRLRLKGSDKLEFAPLGETTQVNLISEWNAPGFVGNFLPEKKNITKSGFTADWKILHFNRNFPQVWKDNSYSMDKNDFGVRLVTLADHYQKNMRTAKYAILIILFTFLSFFLNEIITKQRIHPFQYILVGFAILIFYLLLLSVSEQIGFNSGYFIAAGCILVMVLFYSRTFLNKWSGSFLLTAILAASYAFIFVLMQLESFALLVGSIGLFVTLALVMFLTRKINWYNM